MKTFILLTLAILSVESVKFDIVNLEIGDVWVGILGNSGKPSLENGGFVLKPGQTRSVQAPDDWAGRFWPRTWCDSGSKHCQTGDCGNRLECSGAGGNPPASLVEITLKGDAGNDFYDISLVDGFNIGVSIEPVGGTGNGGQYSCKKASCAYNFQKDCPGELRVNYNNNVIGCKSACIAFNSDEYCCRGSHSTPETCKSSSWPKNYPAYFKSHCPDAYSYAYDDNKSTFTCKANAYIIKLGGAK